MQFPEYGKYEAKEQSMRIMRLKCRKIDTYQAFKRIPSSVWGPGGMSYTLTKIMTLDFEQCSLNRRYIIIFIFCG